VEPAADDVADEEFALFDPHVQVTDEPLHLSAPAIAHPAFVVPPPPSPRVAPADGVDAWLLTLTDDYAPGTREVISNGGSTAVALGAISNRSHGRQVLGGFLDELLQDSLGHSEEVVGAALSVKENGSDDDDDDAAAQRRRAMVLEQLLRPRLPAAATADRGEGDSWWPPCVHHDAERVPGPFPSAEGGGKLGWTALPSPFAVDPPPRSLPLPCADADLL
jgi:hypothetical protein